VVQAIVRSRYGGPEVLELQEVPRPEPSQGQVLVRVRASSVNMADVDYVLGRPWVARMATGLRVPKARIPGIDVAGEVEAVGPGVTRLAVGDRVMADAFGEGSGAWAEYVVLPERALVTMPDGVSFEAAGVTPSSGTFAIQGLRDSRPIKPGDRVLINGASGNVGPFAVQIAKALGAEVTGTCRTEKMAMVRSVGADHVIDYTREDYRDSGERYDLIVDMALRGHLARVRRSLTPGGAYVLIGGGLGGYAEALTLGTLLTLVTDRKVGMLMWRVNDTRDLADLGGMLASGDIHPPIDRTFPLAGLPEALAIVAAGQARGKIAISI
jgi:NADPH:quinone reductase-like Zn-dependent oxidoreductase